jgi:hypothetical protein
LWFWADWKQLREIAGALRWEGIVGAVLITFLGATLLLSAFYQVKDWAMSPMPDGSSWLRSRYVLTVADTAQMVISVCVVLLFTTHNPELVYDAF